MKQSKHKPGEITIATYNTYNPFQRALWEAFSDFYCADVGGYSGMRMPTPGKSMEPSKSYNLDFNDWKKRVIERWEAESKRDGRTKGGISEEFSDNLWYYLYERFMDATNKHYKPKKIPGTPLPRDFGGC